MFFEENFKMVLKDIGKDNLIKNRAILEILENIGAYQSDIVGYGANDTPIIKLTWILLDWKLKVIKRPKYGQTIKVKTWASEANRFFTYRDYEIYADEELVAIATSKWTLVNIEEGKMARITEDVKKAYQIEEKHVFEGDVLGKLTEPKEFFNKVKYKVIRKDIDMNKHMHNLYYLDLAYEALPEDVYENERPFNNVRIMYKKEIKLGDIVNCKYTYQNGKHIVVIKSEDDKNLHAIIELYN